MTLALELYNDPLPLSSPLRIAGYVLDAMMDALAGRFDVVNVKLDKCGGLTEGLRMVERAREPGLKVMAGNTGGTSLAAAPAFVLGQFCDIVDLDGPTFLAADPAPTVRYGDGCIFCGDEAWGAGTAP